MLLKAHKGAVTAVALGLLRVVRSWSRKPRQDHPRARRARTNCSRPFFYRFKSDAADRAKPAPAEAACQPLAARTRELSGPKTFRNPDYWGQIAVGYEPYYAYEEVLANFRDRPKQTASMLYSMTAIASYLTGQ